MQLKRRHRRVLETLLPKDANPTLTKGVFDSGFDDFNETFEKEGHPKLKLSFRVSLFVATWLAPLWIGRIPPLSLYSEATRKRALEHLFASRLYWLRQTALGLKLIVSLCYGADPDVRAAIGLWQPGTGLFPDNT